MINKIQGIQMPKCIQYFETYDLGLHMSATLYDSAAWKFIGWTYRPEENSKLKFQSDGYVSTSQETIFMHTHNEILDSNCLSLIVELTLESSKTDPQIFSIGFFKIDLANPTSDKAGISLTPSLITASPWILVSPDTEMKTLMTKKTTLIGVQIKEAPGMKYIWEFLPPYCLYSLFEIEPMF